MRALQAIGEGLREAFDEQGDAIQVLVQGTPITVTSDAPVVVPLAPVLVLQGRPSVRDIEGSVREDGSVIRAIVRRRKAAKEKSLAGEQGR